MQQRPNLARPHAYLQPLAWAALGHISSLCAFVPSHEICLQPPNRQAGARAERGMEMVAHEFRGARLGQSGLERPSLLGNNKHAGNLTKPPSHLLTLMAEQIPLAVVGHRLSW